MMVPNRKDELERMEAEGLFAEVKKGNKRAASLFARLAAWRLNPMQRTDSWGWLSKSPGETQVDGFSEDAIVFGDDPANLKNVVDLVAGAGAPGASIAWINQPRRPGNKWVAPKPLTTEEMAVLRGGTVENPPGPPVPTPTPAPPLPPPVDLIPVLAEMAKIRADLAEILHVMADLEHVRGEAMKAREEIQRLSSKIDAGLPVDISARWIGRITGTVGKVDDGSR